MRTVLLVASVVVTAYTFFLIFRILIEWFTGIAYGRAWRILKAGTEPPLAAFRWMKFLHRGAVDFTPLPAIITLQLISFLLYYFAVARVVSAASLLAGLLLSLWRILFSILLFFLLLTAVRLISLFVLRRPVSPFLKMIDALVAPLAHLASRLLSSRGSVSYRVVLIILFVVLGTVAATGIFFVEPGLILLNLRSGIDLPY